MMDSEINRILLGSRHSVYKGLNKGPAFGGDGGNGYNVAGPDGRPLCRSPYKRGCKGVC
ncbi:hypothetical protein NC651_037109 [Populus alba x Populus x berolinensis]|nr:hypothetical protein NC651_037109 [Populus alba x Populus x berolinensis]